MNNGKRTALVTGAAVGIGKATCMQLAAEGANVVMVDVNQESLAAAERELRAITPHVRSVVCDVRDPEAVQGAVALAEEAFGGVDILVNNAALWRDSVKFADSSLDLWKNYLDINVMGVVYFTKAVLPHMLEQGWGRIINLASVAGVYGNAKMVHYSATKGAILAMTKALAKEVAAEGITVNSVSPGTVNSSLDPDIDASVPSEVSYAGRTGTARENADLICFLASEKAAYINGQNVQIDGCRKKL